MAICGFLLYRLLSHMDNRSAVPGLWRAGIATLVFGACAIGISEDYLIANEPYWARELSKNSIFTLFAAYQRNTINYNEFYSTLAPEVALPLVKPFLSPPEPNADLIRAIHSDEVEKKWNVVLVVMESMSARYLAHFGNPHPLTPNLDALADAGMFFSNLYATGTRTVRGLEALMLSLPPTPGQSILRRPNSNNLFNIGTLFHDRGYTNQFVYGGYAYFDNMREWFESNGFAVVDRNLYPANEIHFGNAWGVCDEDLFDQALKQQTELNKAGKAFFQVILTTSNHRPYTFPEGRIDMAPHTGRDAAIKYSDFAIGQFMEKARQTGWYDNTLFIFVADHDASVAGGTDIPVHDYLIPAIFYNPKLVAPRKITTIASQIDLSPTLAGLMGFSYRSKFFGQDLTRTSAERALLGTYQKVALLQPHRMTILAPGHSIETQELDDAYNVKKSSAVIAKDASTLDGAARLTVSIYQSASNLFKNGLLHAESLSTRADLEPQ
jgi:phosphoglycerol transferase MdoB-like AlkP superfamily enzyme